MKSAIISYNRFFCSLEHLFVNIRFWIILFFLIRLIGITNPPIEVAHNWRQTTGTMVARNFFEVDNNIFYPRIDIAGEKTGITGMEFPLLNYFIYLVSKLFGYQHWYGRLINLILSSIGLLYFYKLIKSNFTEQISFYSTIILTVSIWFSYSRKIMPDTFACSLVIASLYYGTTYLRSKSLPNHLKNLLFYALLLILGVLSKLPVAYILIIFIIHFLDNKIPLKRKIIFATITMICLVPIAFWYFYWVPYLVKTYGFWHFFMGKSLGEGVNDILQNIPEMLKRFYDTAIKYSGFLVFVLGSIYAIIKKDKQILVVFVLGLVGFCGVIFKAGFTFYHHSYYVIPFVPIMCLVAGYGLSQLKSKKLIILILILISTEGILNQQHDLRLNEKNRYLITLEKELDAFSNKNELILINSGEYPTPMYFAHRKGWVNSNEKIQTHGYIESLRYKGLKYILVLKNTFGTEINLDFKKVIDNENYCFYQL